MFSGWNEGEEQLDNVTGNLKVNICADGAAVSQRLVSPAATFGQKERLEEMRRYK